MRLLRGRRESASSEPGVCVLHKRHAPANLTLEFHHLVPVAWQQLWQPPEPWPNGGNDTEGRGRLFDARGVLCCPTGHRNVHVWIVRLMHTVTSEDPKVAVAAVRARYGSKARGLEFDTALLALQRWKEAGGSLLELVAAKEWGQA